MMPFAVALLCITASFLSIALRAPIHDDEFIAFHIIRCLFYPASNVGDGLCNDMSLRLFHTSLLLPLRVYKYTGSPLVFFHLPFFFLWRHPVSARMVGALALVVQGVLIARLSGVRFIGITVALFFFFPYVYQHIVDAGSTGFQILSLLLIFLLVRQWSETRRFWLLSLAALVLFLGTWIKLSFLWYLPALFIFFVFCVWRQRKQWNRSRAAVHVVLAFLIYGVLLSVLLFASSPGDAASKPFFEQLLSARWIDWHALVHGHWIKTQLLRSFLNPLEATQRSYNVRLPVPLAVLYNFFLYLAAPLVVSLLWPHSDRRVRQSLRESALYFLLFLLTAFVVSIQSQAWAMHHVLLAFPFLILSYAQLFAALGMVGKSGWRTAKIILTAVLCSLPLSFAICSVALSHQTVRDYDDASKVAVNELLHDATLASQYYYVVIDWGMMFYQGLYGDASQAVLWRTHLSASQLEALQSLSAEQGRKLLFIYKNGSNPTVSLIRRTVQIVDCRAIDRGGVWRIAAEESTRYREVCFGSEM